MITPMINVNLRPCTCPVGWPSGGDHWPGAGQSKCAAQPVLIPCPLPRTAEMTVRLGECDCAYRNGHRLNPNDHLIDCPVRPVRITCSIGGETWEASEVVDADNPQDPNGRWGAGTGDAFRQTLTACRNLWGVVKALVLRLPPLDPMTVSGRERLLALLTQRDAVFAALTKLVQAEQAAIAAQAECDAAFPIDNYVRVPAPDHRSEPRPSTVRLAAFVAHVIASVGAL